MEGHHNPKQDGNHKADSCWHLHPDRAPEWWRENQVKWKESKAKNEAPSNYLLSLLKLWVNHLDQNSQLILNSGASAHIFNHANFFSHLELGNFLVLKTGKAKATLPVMGQGKVQLKWGNTLIALLDCLYVPNIVINLVSAGALDKKGCHLSSSGGNFTLRKDGVKVLRGKVSGNLFTVENPTSIGSKHCVNLTQSVLTLQELHETYGHASIPRITSLIPNSITVGDRNNFQCKACVSAKITKNSFKGILTQAKKPFKRIHLDLIGPITPQYCLHH